MINAEMSLEQLALIRTAINVYRIREFSALEKGGECSLSRMPSKKWESLVEKNLPTLKNSSILLKRVSNLMRPLNEEANNWTADHYYILEFHSFPLSIDYQWRSNGTIDRLKTARSFIQSENFDSSLRFQMACIYWLEEDARRLWNEMHPLFKRFLSQSFLPDSNRVWRAIVGEWVKYLESGVEKWSHHSFLHPLSWYCRDGAALQGCLLENLSPLERSEVFRELINENTFNHKRVFCITRMTVNERDEIFAEKPEMILKVFMNWPMQYHFEEMADRIFLHLSGPSFQGFLHDIICLKIKRDWNDFDYVELLKTAWNQSSEPLKKFVQSKEEFYKFLVDACEHNSNKPFKKPCKSCRNIRNIIRSKKRKFRTN
ncbi:uncharacterized protein NPIL_60961 [Nephila pilipes]|uniref:Uncharacterized protein n=1 Tax=Nephila pilipes TaxID=299642 RepID=A0A8X6P0W5_NEPPI|nr:uncharacterized protein NPIL_634621 [Nephila pilipes]GFT41987.1 uncharacterized protein NPIL_60961 [Nephila pilipes]